MAGRRVEISVATTGIDRTVPDTYIRQLVRLVGSSRYVTGDVSHVVVNAGIPTQRELRDQIAKTPCRIAEAVGSHERDATAARSCRVPRQLACQSGAYDTVSCYKGYRSLASEHRRCEDISRNDKSKISSGIEVRVQTSRQIGWDLSDFKFSRQGNVATCRHRGMIIDRGERPTRLLGCGRKASKETWDPETHAAFIRRCAMGRKNCHRRHDDCCNAKSASMG